MHVIVLERSVRSVRCVRDHGVPTTASMTRDSRAAFSVSLPLLFTV